MKRDEEERYLFVMGRAIGLLEAADYTLNIVLERVKNKQDDVTTAFLEDIVKEYKIRAKGYEKLANIIKEK